MKSGIELGNLMPLELFNYLFYIKFPRKHRREGIFIRENDVRPQNQERIWHQIAKTHGSPHANPHTNLHGMADSGSRPKANARITAQTESDPLTK